MMNNLNTINTYNTQTSQLNNLNTKLSSKEDAKLKQACNDFEAIFIKQMFDSMRKTINKTKLIDGGMSEDIFEDMLFEQYAAKMSANSNLGLAKQMYEQLSKTI